jgi:membrane protein implicated in regulation of membrane protease activity
MRENSTIMVIVTAVVMTFALLVAANWMFVPTDASAACENTVCRLYRVASEFQTLISAALAIVAAMVAAKPVWRQVKKMGVEHDILARETIGRRLDGIDHRARWLTSSVQSHLQDVWRNIYFEHDDRAEYDPKAVSIHWAHSMEGDVRDKLSTLRTHQALRSDTTPIEDARSEVITALDALRDCYSDIAAPAVYGGYPETTPEQEAHMEKEAEVARVDLPSRANAVDAAAKRFGKIAEREIERVRVRIREIEDHMLQSPDD